MRTVLLTILSLALALPIVLGASEIVINEIMYNNPGDDVEFIELFNNSNQAINLTNWYLIDDNDAHTPCRLTGTLNAGAYWVIAENIAQFKQKNPAVTNLNANEYGTGASAWSFGNSSDIVRLFDNTGALHDVVAYEDGGAWPGSPDGNGPSLELLNPSLDNALPTSWDPSAVEGGTPGAINGVYTTNVSPTCKNGSRTIDLPTHSDSVPVTVLAFDPEGLARVELFVSSGGEYVSQAMYDDGTHGDAVAGDSLFTTQIAPFASGTLVKYYAVATDNIDQTDSWPNDAPVSYSAYTVDYTPPKLRITEILPVNDSINSDEVGDYDDWFEIQNQDVVTVNLGGMYVSNSPGNSQAFQLPGVSLAPNQFLLIWADNESEQGSLHANFKLSADGEAVALFETIDHGNVLIHGWKYGVSGPNVSMGFPNLQSTAPEYLTPPTPGASNATSAFFSRVCINEFQCTSDFGGTDDWVEIYNRGATNFDLSGCYLSDQRGKNTKWKFPQKILKPGEFLAIYEDELKFGFASEGDDVIQLTAADSTTGLDFYDFGPQTADHSEGRYPDGASVWQFFDEPTKGTSNSNTAVEGETVSSLPAVFELGHNYPNPFNPATVIPYGLPQNTRVKIDVFTLLGGHLKTLVDAVQNQGKHQVVWDGKDASGRVMASGVYLFQMQAGDFRQTRKMILIR